MNANDTCASQKEAETQSSCEWQEYQQSLYLQQAQGCYSENWNSWQWTGGYYW